MDWNARSKSALYSAALFATCLAFFTAAGITANGILAPFIAGEDWASERPLTRGTNALTILAGEYDDGVLRRVEHAHVVVSRATLGGALPVAEGATGPDGRVSFELAPGPYFVQVEHDGMTDQNGVQLESSQRLGAYFMESGEVFWRQIAHSALEDRGDVATLRVLAVDRGLCRPEGGGTYCAAIPEPGALVEVFRDGVLVATTYTGDATAVELPVASYRVHVELSGRVAETQILLLCDAVIDVEFDADGGAVQRQGCPSQAVGVRGSR